MRCSFFVITALVASCSALSSVTKGQYARSDASALIQQAVAGGSGHMGGSGALDPKADNLEMDTPIPQVDLSGRLITGGVLVLILVFLAVVAYLHFDRIVQMPRNVLLANSCVLLYTAATITADIIMQTLHRSSGTAGYKFHPSVMVLLAEFGKLLLNGSIAVVDYQQTRLCSSGDFLRTMKVMVLPAGCFFALNLLRYHALANADLSEYRVFRSFDVVIVAVLWCLIFKKALNFNQIMGVGLVTLSCVTLGLGSSIMSGTSVRGWQTAIVLLMAFISSLGMVTNEMGFRALPHLSLFTQNCCLYVVTCSMNVVYILAEVPWSTVLDGIDHTAMILLIVEVLLGMCVSCVLKYADAIVKQLATGWITPLEPLIGHWLVGTALTPVSVGCTLIAGLGNIIYRLEPAKEPEK